jgi:LmbE family N-acetylglucosaminyl deacetylase
MKKRILIVAAHADDEVLGCGGTILRHVDEGDEVYLILMSDGVGSRSDVDEKALTRRIKAANEAHSILGITEVHFLNLPDNAMDSVPLLQIVHTLEPMIEKISPDIIYTHFYGDLNVDHRITHQAVMTICRPQPRQSVKEIYGFEILSSTEWVTPNSVFFKPVCYFDISNQLDRKLQALVAYIEEMREIPHSRSIEHAEILAKHRGFIVGRRAAEAFEVYRLIR